MKVDFVTPSADVASGDFDSVLAPGLRGCFEVLPGHAHMVSALSTGMLTLNSGSKKLDYIISGGVLEVQEDQVKILVDEFYALDAISSGDAKQALEDINRRLLNEDLNDAEFEALLNKRALNEAFL